MENSTIAISDIAYLLGFIVSVWGVVKIFKEVVTPYRIKMKEIEKNSEYLKRDDKRIKDLEDSHAMIYECLIVMLNHEITGNGVAKEGTMYTNVAGDSKKVIDIYFNVLGEAKEAV